MIKKKDKLGAPSKSDKKNKNPGDRLSTIRKQKERGKKEGD